MPRTKKTVTQEVAQQEQKMPTVLKQPITANTPKLDALIAELIDEEGNCKFNQLEYDRMQTARDLFWVVWNNYGSYLASWSLSQFAQVCQSHKQIFSKKIVENYSGHYTDHESVTTWEVTYTISKLGKLHDKKKMSLTVIDALKALIKVIEKHVEALDIAIEVAEELQAVTIENYSDIIPEQRFEFRHDNSEAEYVQFKMTQLEK